MNSLRLRELRNKHKKTQQEVAVHLKISRDAYSLYELGKRQMNYESLCLLADFYGVSVDYLLGRYDTNPVVLSGDELDIVNRYRQLDKRGQETIKANLTFEESHMRKSKIEKRPAM